MARVKRRPTAKPRQARGQGTRPKIDPRRGTWVVRVPVGKLPGGRTKYREVHADTQAEVVARAKAVAPPGPDVTVAEWSERWLAASPARPSTKGDYRHTVDQFVVPSLGARRVRDVTSHDVEVAVLSWAARLNPNTARKNLRHLRMIFAAARRAGVVPTNVAADARGPKSRRVPVAVFSADELARIVAAAAASDRPGDALFALMGAVGCRIGEALALDATDLRGDLLSIDKTYSLRHGTRRTKSENGVRTVRVPAAALEAVRRAAAGRTRGPLFPTHDGLRRRTEHGARARWRLLLRDLGVPYRKPHALRHSVATHSIAAGVPVANVARDLGDAVDTIIRTYCHPTAGATTADAMDALLGGAK